MLKALACAAALTVCASGVASAAAPAAKVTYVITFNGFCDGQTLNVYKGIYTTGTATGCLAGNLLQGLNTSVNKFSGLVVTGNQGNAPSLYTYSLELTKMKWAVYTSNGSTYAKLNSGTFTLSGEAPNASAPKSTLAK